MVTCSWSVALTPVPWCCVNVSSRMSRVAIVTGAARGVGRVIAASLAREGYRVVLVDVTEPVHTAAEIEAAGGALLSSQTDVSREADVVALVRAVREWAGRVDVLVNNAGISMLEPAERTSAAQWRRVLDVNLTGPFLSCREVGKAMLAAQSGSIVNIASIAGLRGISDRVAYNSSKHGLIGLTSTLAAEWGGRGVRVNAVCPGWIKTEMDAEDQASRRVHRRRHREPGPDGPVRAPRRCRTGRQLSRRPGSQRIRQRRRDPS